MNFVPQRIGSFGAGGRLVAGGGRITPATFFDLNHQACNDLTDQSRLVFIGQGNIARPFIFIPFHEADNGTAPQ